MCPWGRQEKSIQRGTSEGGGGPARKRLEGGHGIGTAEEGTSVGGGGGDLGSERHPPGDQGDSENEDPCRLGLPKTWCFRKSMERGLAQTVRQGRTQDTSQQVEKGLGL